MVTPKLKNLFKNVGPLVWGYRQLQTASRTVAYRQDYRKFQTLNQQVEPRFALNWHDRYPCLTDKTSATGFDRHYVFHPAWAARILARTKPDKHIDVGSNLQFCGIASAFVPMEFYDIRPADLGLSNLDSKSGDLLNLPFTDNSVKSLSCMHVVEHVGLGRYGDPLDPDGDLKAIHELKRVAAPNGDLLFVVPVGQPRIQFNAHRVYAYDQILAYFAGFRLQEFALIPESPADGGLVINPDQALTDRQMYGCGCFWFVKQS
ncbi:MAG: DUF268 domain-containing protein [Chloroflexi bacterium]|nr:DUF268 domain-containing protein [Chloroflexota bacterium]